MPSSVTSIFGEPDEFQAALRHAGVVSLLVVDSGHFRARLTQITLHELQLSSCNEQLSRIAFVQVPADLVVVTFSMSNQPTALLWRGMETRTDEMITFGPGVQLHARTEGGCSWGMIHLPREDLAQYSRELSGVEITLPGVRRWRPPRALFRQLRHLHQAAARAVELRSGPLIDRQAAHGLEQQVIHSLVDCLSASIAKEETPAAQRHRAILARFEELLSVKLTSRVSEISAALEISERMMLACCNTHLGMGPGRYLCLRRMQAVHRTLQSTDSRAVSVSEVASQQGFHNLDRFAQTYHALYGEFPSATFRGRSKVALKLGSV